MKIIESGIVAIAKHDALFTELSNLVKQHPQRFRDQAAKAFSSFTLRDRQVAQSLDCQDVSAYDVLRAWESKLLPARTKLGQARTADQLHKALAKQLGLGADAAAQKASQLIMERNGELLQECIDSVYPLEAGVKKDRFAEVRMRAAELLEKPDIDIANFKKRYVEFVLYRHLAATNNIAIYDPFAPWLERKRATLQASKDKRRATREEKQKLARIANRLNELAASHEGLVAQVATKGWDAATIMSLKNAYEKQLKTAAQPVAPARRLAIFDAVTREFCDRETERLAAGAPQYGLESIRLISEDIVTLLTRLFDLTNVQKNELVLQLKEYRMLINERDALAARLGTKEKQE